MKNLKTKDNDQIRAKSGYLFNRNDEYWILDKNTKIPVIFLRGYLKK
jgi:hypothetical protein